MTDAIQAPAPDLAIPPAGSADVEALGVNVIRGLALDGPHAARSGHQGTAMALAPLAHALFTRVLRYDASDPTWPDRDRFVLSAGHASILHYAMLYLTGQGLELDDLRQFRQWGSKTPGHPEAGHTAGIEVTTGPLGQGLANAVGLATAERHLRARFGSDLADHYTFVIAGDGCLSEGVSHEAASLAGHQGLGRLIAVYDDNQITIDGHTDLSLSDDAPGRFRSYGWDVDEIGEVANDVEALTNALERAKGVDDKPTLIVVRSHIGYPSPTWTDKHEAHGLAFGTEDITEVKAAMGMPDEPFWVPDEVLALYREAGRRGQTERMAWEQRLDASPHQSAWRVAWEQKPTFDVEGVVAGFERGGSVATRKASQTCVTALAESGQLIGGAADLTGNTGTKISGDVQSAANPAGNQVYFGVREHAMGSFLVGAAAHGGVVPIGGTFLVFADYMRPPVRLAAMSKTKCVFVWTHDSLGVGEDGPTHQPVEQIMTLRAIPDLQVFRPADAVETAGAWQAAMDAEGPSAMILSRQNLPVLAASDAAAVARGAYAVVDQTKPDVVLVGTGSEVSLCVEAAEQLAADGVQARVVSMPCWELFEAQPEVEQRALLDPALPRISIEAGVTLGWQAWADRCLGIDRFGHSAPGQVALDNYGMNAASVVAAARDLLS